MDAKFYEADHDGKPALFFRLEKPSIADPFGKAEPFIFEGLATEKHKKEYANAFLEFVAPLLEAALAVAVPGSKVAVYGYEAVKALEKVAGELAAAPDAPAAPDVPSDVEPSENGA